MPEYRSASGSAAEDLFIDLFTDTFGAEKAGFLYSQYPFYDIYQNARFADFVLENGATRVAIEIDDEASHNPRLVSQDKFYDDLLKQNSMIHLGWDVYRWAVRQMQKQPETVKDELRVFLGSDPRFKEIEDYLPTQQGRAKGRSAGTTRVSAGSPEFVGSDAAESRNHCSSLSCHRHRQNGHCGHGREALWWTGAVRCAHDGTGQPGIQNHSGFSGRFVRNTEVSLFSERKSPGVFR